MLQPILGNILIKIEIKKEETEAGIIIPDSSEKEENVGTVMSIGQGRTDKNGKLKKITSVKVGDKIIFNQFAAQEVGQDDLLVIKEDDIIGVYENKD